QRDRPALVGEHTPDRGVHVEVCRLLSGGERERVVLRGQPQAVVVRFGLVDDGQLLLVEPGRDQLHPLPFGPVRRGGQVAGNGDVRDMPDGQVVHGAAHERRGHRDVAAGTAVLAGDRLGVWLEPTASTRVRSASGAAPSSARACSMAAMSTSGSSACSDGSSTPPWGSRSTIPSSSSRAARAAGPTHGESTGAGTGGTGASSEEDILRP